MWHAYRRSNTSTMSTDVAAARPTAPARRSSATTGVVPTEAIDDVVRQIVERFQPQRVILFGSYAYGEPHPGSDVDLLVFHH